ncbi:MAG: quinolinate synthase NadA [Candidatus Omnitrophica bacterium]|nr:quinolinate synthase NadA [Candidatus Omnitrophota bacterium]
MFEHKSERDYNEKLKIKIEKLKKKREAIIIVHNYQRDEVQDIADITGDSLALSQAAVKTDARVIVFCGVHFMAESAAILNPDKTILLPAKEAGCPLADMITVEKLKALKEKHPGAPVVCYVNTSAAIKAESDICCTSSNAVNIVRSLRDDKKVIFVPDKNLGLYVQSQLPDKEIILWEGFCPTHIKVQEEHIRQAKTLHPDALVIAHPECNSEVLNMSDQITSTGGMIKYINSSDKKKFIIVTESGLFYKLKKDNPDKEFFLPTEQLICPNMKLTTLGWVYHALELMAYKVNVPADIARKAKVSLDRMLKVSGEPSGSAISGV